MEDTVKLVCKRGELTHSSSACKGSMVAVRASSTEVIEAILASGQQASIALAAVNGGKSVVLSGSDKSVDIVLK